MPISRALQLICSHQIGVVWHSNVIVIIDINDDITLNPNHMRVKWPPQL